MKIFRQARKRNVFFSLLLMVAFVGALASFFAHNSSAADAWWDTDWSHRSKLVFNNSDQSSSLTNFTVLVQLTPDRIDYSNVKTGGADLRFVDADGSTELDFEIERWDTNATSTVWVEVPSITGSSASDFIYVYYGNAAASSAEDIEGTWSNNYLLVQHMNEDPSGSAPQFVDSTSNDFDGTSAGTMTSGDVVAGQIASSTDFEGTDDYVDFGDIISAANGTAEVWFNVGGDVTGGADDDYLVSKVKSGANDGEWRLFLDNADSKLTFQTDCTVGSGATIDSNSAISTDTWYYGAVTWDDDTAGGQIMYVDGVAQTSTATTNCGLEVTGENLNFGRNNALDQDYFSGQMDEVRISSVVRSADWMAAQNLSMRDTFISYGSPENQDWWNESWQNRVKISFDNSSQSETLTDFPVLVQLDSSRVTYGNINADYSDLRFIDSDNETELQFEVENWNTSGTSTVWVKVPSVTGGVDTDHIYMYYGNGGATGTATTTGVWNSGYVAVHHFGSSTAATYTDSTANSHNSDGIAVVDRTGTTGSIGNAPQFDGGDATDYITLPDSNDFDMTSYTIEAYVNSQSGGTTVSSGSGGTVVYPIVDKGLGEAESAAADVQFLLGFDASNKVAADFEAASTSANQSATGTTAVTRNGTVWYHVAMRMDNPNDEFSVFLNGTEEGSVARSDNPATGGTMKVGIGAGTKTGGVLDGGFDGHIDEVRISNVPRSDDWLAATALTMSDSFASFGSEETDASITNANVEPASLLPGAVGNVVVSFTTTSATPLDGKIVVTFPTDLGSGFAFDSGASTAVTSVSGFDGSLSVSVASNVVTLTRSGGSSSGAGSKSFTLTNVKNPTSTGSTGAYQIKTTTSGDVTIDDNTAVSADTIAAGSISSANVEPVDLTAEASGDVSVSFTTANTIPSDGKIVIIFPTTAGSFTFDSGGTTDVSNISGIDGTLTVATSSNTITITRSGGTASTAGSKSFVLSNIQNPSGNGTTGTYTIRTTDSSDVVIDENTSVSADTLVADYPFGDEVVFYRFESGTATVVNSGAGGATYNSSYSGAAATTSTAKFGNYGATFGETGDYVDLGYGTGINPSTASTTIAFWVYKNEAAAGCNTGDDDHVFGVSGPDANTRLYIRCRNAGWAFRLGGNAEVTSVSSAEMQTWTHIALVLNADDDTAYFYINGEEEATGAVPNFTIGRDFWVGNFNDATTDEGSNATFDDVGVWDRGLSAGEVLSLYNASFTPGVPSDLTATAVNSAVHLRWTEASGTTTDYVIEYKESAGSTWSVFTDGISTATSTTVTGLTNDTAYDFRVSATNENGTGNPSTSDSATPYELIEFISPTIGEGVSTTSSSIIVYASSTFNGVSTIFRLEDDEGSLISQATTTERYGNYNLANLTQTLTEFNMAITADLSGQAYIPGSDTMLTVHNNQNILSEINTDGSTVRTVTCTACGDIEAITLTDSVADGGSGSFINTFMIATEGVSKLFEITVSSSTTAVNDSNDYALGLGDQGNFGVEGLAYDSVNDVFYGGKEKTPMALYEIDISPSVTVTSICDAPTLFSGVITDISDLDYVESEETLYVLSDESDKVVAVDVSDTENCSIINQFSIGDMTQPEGIVWDDRGDYLYVTSEPDDLSVWRTNQYTLQHTFTGLADGDYVLYVSTTDVNGATATTTARSFTILNDVTAPTISTATSDKANGSYKAGEVIDIDVTFSEAVTSTGNVTVTMNTGGTCTFAVSASSTGTCNYTVGASENTSDLAVSSISGTIKDVSNNSMSDFSIGSNFASKDIVIDTTAPIISSVTSTTANGTYNADDDINITVTFAEVVTSTGSVTVTLDTGDTCTFTATATTTGSCTYTVSSDDDSDDLTTTSISGTIADVAGNAMTNFTPVSNLAASSAIIVEGTPDAEPDPEPEPEPEAEPEVEESEGRSSHRRVSPARIFSGVPVGQTVSSNSGNAGSSGGSSSSFERSLRLGDTGADVRQLQRFLNAQGFMVTTFGPGSVGQETAYFGPATQAALIRFQNAYASQVLTPVGLSQGTGFFGASTRAFVNLFTALDTTSSTPTSVTTPEPETASDNTSQFQTAATFVANGSFEKDLWPDTIDEDVRTLQQFLNAQGFTVATSGPGSPGNETNIYGPATVAAVKAFQEAHAAEILTPAGFSSGTGIFGPSTRAFANTLISR